MADHTSTTPKEFRNLYQTPHYLANWLDHQFDFDVDLAANDENALCDNYFTLEQNSLEQDWSQFKCGFLNPPYDKVEPWVKKAIAEMQTGFVTVMLIPTANGEGYYADVFRHASEILYITGRVSFIAACDWEVKLSTGKIKQVKKGEKVPGNTRGSFVVVFEKKKKKKTFPKVVNYMRTDLEKKFG